MIQKKRIVSCLLVLSMLFTFMPAGIVTADEGQDTNTDIINESAPLPIQARTPQFDEPVVVSEPLGFDEEDPKKNLKTFQIPIQELSDEETEIIPENDISAFAVSSSANPVPDMINGINHPKLNGGLGNANENISTYTGDLQTSFTDMYLPGRNGLDFNLTRFYQSNQTTIPHYRYLGQAYNKKGVDIGKKWLVGFEEDTIYTKQHDLGLGWAFAIPMVQERKDGTYYHDGTGGVYKYDEDTPFLSNLYGYSVNNEFFRYDTSLEISPKEHSRYSFKDAQGVMNYFDQDGHLVLKKDRFNNQIKYEYDYVPGPDLLRKGCYYGSVRGSGGMIPNSDSTIVAFNSDQSKSGQITIPFNELPSEKMDFKFSYILKNGISGFSGNVEVRAKLAKKNTVEPEYLHIPLFNQYVDSSDMGTDIKSESFTIDLREYSGEYYNITFYINVTNGSGEMQFGRFILTQYEKQLSKVTDTVGRIITFDYQNNNVYEQYEDYAVPQVLSVTARTPDGQQIKKVDYYRTIIQYSIQSREYDSSEYGNWRDDRYHILVGVDNGEYYSPLLYDFSNESAIMYGGYAGFYGEAKEWSSTFSGRPLLVAVGNRNSMTYYSYERYRRIIVKEKESTNLQAWKEDFRIAERFDLPYELNAEIPEPPGITVTPSSPPSYMIEIWWEISDKDILSPVLPEGAVKRNRVTYDYGAGTNLDFVYKEPGGYGANHALSQEDWEKIAPGQYVVKVQQDDGLTAYYEYVTHDYGYSLYQWLLQRWIALGATGDLPDRYTYDAKENVLGKVTVKDESQGGTGDYTETIYHYGQTQEYNKPYQVTTNQYVAGQKTTTITKNESNDMGTLDYETAAMTEAEAQAPVPYETRYEYHSIGNNTYLPSKTKYIKDGQNIEVSITYDTQGRPIKSTDALGNETLMYYENATYPWMLTKQEVKDINKDGTNTNTETIYEYGDSYLFGPTKVKVLGENGQYAETSYEYEPKFGNVVKQTDAKGGITRYEYDAKGRPTKAVYPQYQAESGMEHVEEDITYTDHVLVNGQYLLLMHKVSYQVSGDTRTPVTFEKGYYDDYGNALRVENDLGVAIYTYDDYNRIKQYQNPQDNAAGVLTYDYSFDGLGRLTGVTDKNGFNGITYGPLYKESYFKTGTTVQNQYKETYDVRGNVLETYSQPQNGTWQKTASFTYSPRGLLLSQADGKGQVTSFAYDNANNLIKTTLADGSETEYTYAKVGDQNGNSPKDMIQKSEGEEFIYHRTYNNLGMLKSAWQSGGEGAHQPYSYTYNLWGGLQSVTDPKGQATTYGYDTLGNATTITKTDETLTYKYNQFGKVDLAQRVRNGQTETADYEYSNLGYLTKKTENGKVLTYTYDLYGKVLSMTDQLGMTTAYEYNEKNQITKVTADGKEFTYTYYPNGLVQSLTYPASKNGTKVATNYTYDNANRLTNVSTPALNESYSYSYDENSNINGVNNNVEFFYDEVNRIAMSNFKSVGNTQNLYSYDGRGNIKNHVSNKTLPSPKPYTYTYDASNRVKEVTNGSTAVVSYDYDLDGIRNKKTVNGTTTDYYTANGNVLAEKAGSTERHNVWTDRILARKDGTTWYYLIYDGLNDVRKVITDSASIVANYTYDEWGNILEKSGSYADQNPIRYKGEYCDEETGFIYLRARYYDPTIGRFITEDPILDGQNWYVYCGANPIMLIDPSGLDPQGKTYYIVIFMGIMTNDGEMSQVYQEIERQLKELNKNNVVSTYTFYPYSGGNKDGWDATSDMAEVAAIAGDAMKFKIENLAESVMQGYEGQDYVYFVGYSGGGVVATKVAEMLDDLHWGAYISSVIRIGSPSLVVNNMWWKNRTHDIQAIGDYIPATYFNRNGAIGYSLPNTTTIKLNVVEKGFWAPHTAYFTNDQNSNGQTNLNKTVSEVVKQMIIRR